jgi:glycine oxidase
MADVAIAGGGVIGCAAAFYLADAGASVTLFERGGLAGAASGAAAGILGPLAEAHRPGPFLDFALEGLRLHRTLAETLPGEAGIDPEYLPTPVLRIALSRSEERALDERLRWQERSGLALRRLTASEARALEPRLSPRVRAAVLSEDERQVNAGLLTQALAEAARRRGAKLSPGAPVTGFVRRRGRVAALRAPAGAVEADAFLLAAGPWTPSLARGLGLDLPVVPRRGQMLAYSLGSSNPRQIVWSEGGYLVPKSGGHLFAGATVEDVGFRPRTTRAGLAGVRRAAVAMLPVLRRMEVASSWAALRPGTPDGLPIIGPLPGWENVFVAAGHFRNGILLGPITGKLIAGLITEGRTQMSLAPFSAARFG